MSGRTAAPARVFLSHNPRPANDQQPRTQLLGEAETGREALRLHRRALARRRRHGHRRGSLNGIEATRAIVRQQLWVRVVMSMHSDRHFNAEAARDDTRRCASNTGSGRPAQAKGVLKGRLLRFGLAVSHQLSAISQKMRSLLVFLWLTADR
jgi:hypothetical protein